MQNRTNELVISLINKKEALLNLINRKYPDVLTEISIDVYISMLGKYPRYTTYKYVGRSIKNINNQIIHKHTEEALVVFLKLLVIRCIELSIDQMKRNVKFPDSIGYLVEMSFSRLLKKIQVNSSDADYYRMENGRFCKDLGISRLKLIPLGPQYAYNARISLGFLFRGGFNQFFSGLWLLFKLRGIGPVYRMHMFQTDVISMSYFNEKGWEQCFENAAFLLMMNKNIRALIGTGWFFDRKLNELSPKFDYLIKMIDTIGGLYFYQGWTQHAAKNALYMNHERKKLYEDGLYMPTYYLVVISRDKLINWYQKKRPITPKV